MPKEKNTKLIPKIYKRNFEHLGLFFWVEAQIKIVPTIKICQAIKSYYDFVGGEYDPEIAAVTFSRLRAEYIDLNYNKNEDT